MTDLNKERELFEEAYLSVGGKQRELELEDGEYTNSKSQLGWELWQIKAKAQAVPEGYVVVPKDVAERTIGHIGIAICHPNNTRDEENIMCEEQVVIERAIEASESGAEG